MKDTKEIILKTALDMFMYNNYEAVTINSIIHASGLTKGAIYHYFVSKEDLFKAVVDKYMLENRADTTVEFLSLKDFIQYSIDIMKGRMTKLILENPTTHHEVPINYLSLMVDAFRHYPNYAKIGTLFIKSQKQRWEIVINKAIEKGEIRKDIDVEVTIANFLNLGSGIVTNMIMGGSIQYGLEMFERQYWDLYKYIKE
jgi:AcrR family transcriptional regulator